MSLILTTKGCSTATSMKSLRNITLLSNSKSTCINSLRKTPFPSCSKSKKDGNYKSAPVASLRQPILCQASCSTVSSEPVVNSDVIIIGSGIIGLACALDLMDQGLSVTVLDKGERLCTGATGAGQGYLWMAHRDPPSPSPPSPSSSSASSSSSSPDSPSASAVSIASWDLAAEGLRLWRERIASGHLPADVVHRMEWQSCGSILLAQNQAEVEELKRRAISLRSHGVHAVVLSARELSELEPTVCVAPEGGALYVESDAQINGKATTHALLDLALRRKKFHHQLGSEVSSFQTGLGSNGLGSLVADTQGRRFASSQALVIAAGAWSGHLIDTILSSQPCNDNQTKKKAKPWAGLFRPRRGHLLELFPCGVEGEGEVAEARVCVDGEREGNRDTAEEGREGRTQGTRGGKARGRGALDPFPVMRHGVMEMSYTRHYARKDNSSLTHHLAEDDVDITFTATSSRKGSLLLGSSREFSGWDPAASFEISLAILQHAAAFLPSLDTALYGGEKEGRGLRAGVKNRPPTGNNNKNNNNSNNNEDLKSTKDLAKFLGVNCRVGLRPFNSTGLPLVGPIPDLKGVFVAAGHEGSGLCMCPSTSQLLTEHVLFGGGVKEGERKTEGEKGQWRRRFKELDPAIRKAAADL